MISWCFSMGCQCTLSIIWWLLSITRLVRRSCMREKLISCQSQFSQWTICLLCFLQLWTCESSLRTLQIIEWVHQDSQLMFNILHYCLHYCLHHHLWYLFLYSSLFCEACLCCFFPWLLQFPYELQGYYFNYEWIIQ